ncbi:MAG TPA: uroporphyrinogen decarboxylase family protein [Anaerolineae bacterium]
MNSRERVTRALKRQGLPDRVPLQFDLCRSLLEEAGQKYGIPVQYSRSYYEDVTYRISANDLRTAMGSDCVVVGAGLPAGFEYPRTEDGCIVNEFGMVMRPGILYYDVVGMPFPGAVTADDVRRFPFPDPLAPGRFENALRDIARFKDRYFVVGDLELTMFEMAWHMTGMEKFMVDMSSGEEYIEVLLDRVLAFSAGVGKRLVELGVDGIWSGDDFGGQNGMLISPRMWRKLFKPRMAELWQELKHANPDVMIMYHSDGAVAPILNDLIEIGLEVFNPVQPNVPGHDPEALKTQYGDRLSFWGAIDQQQLLPFGTPEQIDADVAEKMRVLGRGGGYMCGPAHIVQSDTSLANVEAFITAVKQHGAYA